LIGLPSTSSHARVPFARGEVQRRHAADDRGAGRPVPRVLAAQLASAFSASAAGSGSPPRRPTRACNDLREHAGIRTARQQHLIAAALFRAAANMSAVWPLVASTALTGAPRAINSATASALPDAAATISTVVPLLLASLALAPAVRSAETIGAWPFRAAMKSGVMLPMRVAARTLARRRRGPGQPDIAMMRRPVERWPSPSATLTSAPAGHNQRAPWRIVAHAA
jgi:hypothetical protein